MLHFLPGWALFQDSLHNQTMVNAKSSLRSPQPAACIPPPAPPPSVMHTKSFSTNHKDGPSESGNSCGVLSLVCMMLCS